jgi:hypothetical protein
MRKKILFGLLVYAVLELFGGITFYIISTTQYNSDVTIIDTIKIVSITLLFYIFFNATAFFMLLIGQEKNFIRVLHMLFYMVIFGIIWCIIISFSDYFSIAGILFLIPILISCIIWLKK